MNIFSKDSLKEKLRKIRALGWVETQRKWNDGGVGNTLEDLLGIEENNLPLPNAGEWELKVQRADTTSLVTLFHMEPSPRCFKFVPAILLPKYGWPHRQAGARHGSAERSFRQTLTAGKWTDRGFTAAVNRTVKRVEVYFDATEVDIEKHEKWIATVKERVGLGDLDPQPYWGFEDLFHKAGTKLKKTVYVIAERRKKRDGAEFFRYSRFLMLENFSFERFLEAIERGDVLVDFDARTGHNHGTKFRLRQNAYQSLYTLVTSID